MTKRLSCVIGEYLDKNTNQQKAEWQNVGVLITGKNGKEYALLDPTVNLAGVLLKQNVLATKKNEAPSDMVMSSVFDEQQSSNQGQQQSGYNQQPAPQQQGYNQNQNQGYNQNQG